MKHKKIKAYKESLSKNVHLKKSLIIHNLKAI